MSTVFTTSYTEGDIVLSSHSKQYAAAVNKVEDGSAFWAPDAGANDNYAYTLATDVTAYTAGLFVHLKPNTTNTGTATLNLNSVGSNIIKKGNGDLDLEDGDLVAGNIYLLVYNGSNFVLVGQADTNNKIKVRAVNGEAFSIKKGQPVRLSAGGAFPTAVLAQGNSANNSAFGIAETLVAAGDPFDVIRIGPVSSSDWTDVIGSTNLTFGEEYFLGQGSAGVMDISPPTGAGDIVQLLGRATSTTKFFVDINDYFSI